MSAKVIPFPLIRRTHDVELLAGNMAAMPHGRAEQYLRARMRRAAAILSANGVDDVCVQAEVQSFETAIRVALWRRSISQGGAA